MASEAREAPMDFYYLKYIYIYIYIYTSVDPSLCSDVSYVEPKKEWNCLNRCCEQESFVKEFRIRSSSYNSVWQRRAKS